MVSKYFGTRKDEEGQLAPAFGTCLGVGVMPWFAIHQHAGGRIIFDGASADVAKKNSTTMIVNTWWSMTNLATAMRNGDTGQKAAFRLLMTREQYLADRGGIVFLTADNKYLKVAELPWM